MLLYLGIQHLQDLLNILFDLLQMTRGDGGSGGRSHGRDKRPRSMSPPQRYVTNLINFMYIFFFEMFTFFYSFVVFNH